MPVNLHAILDASIIELDTIDSTNNYAMRLIDADTAQEGMTILAAQQTYAKGQRGNVWQSEPGKNIMMSLIVHPKHSLSRQFLFNVAATSAVVQILQNICENIRVQIKWPNDIIINDKKAGGVLIENVLRGSNWNYSVIGIGLNINQIEGFDKLPHATSLSLQTGMSFNVTDLALKIRKAVLEAIYSQADNSYLMRQYNDNLYKKNLIQLFHMQGRDWNARILDAVEDGRLRVMNPEGDIEFYTHGTQQWKWQ